MKEIDFLPEWYKSGRRRQIGYRAQLVGLGGIFVVMMVWSFFAVGSVSRAKAELVQMALSQGGQIGVSREFDRIRNLLKTAEERADVLEEIDSRIDVAGVLAEISFLIDKKVVLSRVEFCAERFVNEQAGRPNSVSVVRPARGNPGNKGGLSAGDVRFKVLISGVAADGSEVAKLICGLEDSPYFCQVYLSFSRNAELKALPKENFQVSEFEISCYLANYRQE